MYRKYMYNLKSKIFWFRCLDKYYIVENKNPSSFKQNVKVYEEEDSIFSMIVQLLSTLRKKFSFLEKNSNVKRILNFRGYFFSSL